MKLSDIVLGMSLLLGTTNAVDMSYYTAGYGVEPGFRTWLEKLYLASEDLTANHTWTDFFVYNTGKWTPGNLTAVGQTQLVQLKRQLLPPQSNQIWSHLPNITTVYSETPTTKTYQINGTINKDLAGYAPMGIPINNCSAQYYQERLTVNKYTSGGKVNLAPYGYSLVLYDDYGLQPAYSPNSMPCVSPAS